MKTNIIEGNKLIAEFMGYNTHSEVNFCQVELSDRWIMIDNWAKYNSSWNWLMPVIEKIEKTKQADIVIHVKNLVQISFNKETKSYYSGLLIENAWAACVEFIEWYNKNK